MNNDEIATSVAKHIPCSSLLSALELMTGESAMCASRFALKKAMERVAESESSLNEAKNDLRLLRKAIGLDVANGRYEGFKTALCAVFSR